MNDTQSVIDRVAKRLEALGLNPDAPAVLAIVGEFRELLARNANLRNFLAVCEAQQNALVRLCYHAVRSSSGRVYYLLNCDVPPDTETDHDTEAEAEAAVMAAAKYRTPEAFQ